MADDLKELGEKLEKASHHNNLTDQQKRDAENMSTGMRAGTELVGAIMVGGFLGWVLDGWLGTKPIFLIILLLLGVTAGFVNVWRATQNIGGQIGYSQLHQQKKDAKTAPDNRESEQKPE